MEKTRLKVRGSWLLIILCCLAPQLCLGAGAIHQRKLLDDSDSSVFPWYTKPSPDTAKAESGPTPSNTSDGPFVANSKANSSAAAAPLPAANQTCPQISLKLNSIEIYDNIISRPDAAIAVQCYTKDGSNFPTMAVFPADADVVRSITGARYRVDAIVAQITCGQAVSCAVSYSYAWAPNIWSSLAEGGCWFDYRHFTQLSYQEPLSAWTCTKMPVRYTLECVECMDPNFPWETALALAGPPLSESEGMSSGTPTLNSVMVIIAIAVVGGAVILVVTALLLRTRRRNVEQSARMSELVARTRERERDRRRRGPPAKPPPVFVVGDPKDSPPPADYDGPIVVLHCGEGEEIRSDEDGNQSSFGDGTNADGGMLLRLPHIAIARPVVQTRPERSTSEASTSRGSENGSSRTRETELAASVGSGMTGVRPMSIAASQGGGEELEMVIVEEAPGTSTGTAHTNNTSSNLPPPPLQ